MSELPTESWMAAANERYRQSEIHPVHRPCRAWRDFSRETGWPLELRGRTVSRIFEWFRSHAFSDVAISMTFFRATFYFDAVFWPMSVPLIYGTARIDLWSALPTLPDVLKRELAADTASFEDFLLAWSSAADWSLSVADLRANANSPLACDMLVSANRQLVAAGDALRAPHPSMQSAFSAALAIEMSAKRLLAVRTEYDTAQAKSHGHDLRALLESCSSLMQRPIPREMLNRCSDLPSIASRYAGAERGSRYLWDTYLTALVICSSLIREESGRETRASVETGGSPRA